MRGAQREHACESILQPLIMPQIPQLLKIGGQYTASQHYYTLNSIQHDAITVQHVDTMDTIRRRRRTPFLTIHWFRIGMQAIAH